MNSSPCKYTVVVQTPPFFKCPGCQNLCLVGDVILCRVPIKTEKVNSEVGLKVGARDESSPYQRWRRKQEVNQLIPHPLRENTE